MKQRTVTVEVHVDTTEFRRQLQNAIRSTIALSRQAGRRRVGIKRRKPLIHKGKKP